MTEKEYNASEGVRRSALWWMRESPEKYKYHLEHPEPQTPALIFGSAVHKLLLEPETFGDEFAIAPDVDRRTRDGKWEYKRFAKEAEEKQIISYEDYCAAQQMTEKAQANPWVRQMLTTQKEVPFFWTDAYTGLPCKVRVDILAEGGSDRLIVADYKTAVSAKTEVFVHKMFDYGYHLQAYMYTEAVMQSLHLVERPEFVFIVQEKKAPYAINLISVTDDVMLAGMDAFRLYMGMLKDCTETGYFYGYNGPFDELNEAFLPGYMQMGTEEA